MSRYTARMMSIQTNDELNIMGATPTAGNSNRYIGTGIENMYIPSANLMPIVSTSLPVPLKYLVNTLPYRSTVETSLNGYLYPGTLIENNEIVIYAHNTQFRTIMGMYLEESTSCVKINFSAKTITTNNKVKNYCVFNTTSGILLNDKPVGDGTNFIYWNGCIVQQQMNILHSTIVHPLSLTYFRPLCTYLENSGISSVPFKIYTNSGNLSTITSIDLYKLKMLFSYDGVSWYKYNTGTNTFSPASPSGTYFTFSELNEIGIDYTTYASIPTQKYIDTFGPDITNLHVITNGWILPRYIKHSNYSDVIDTSQFMWFQLSGTLMLPYVGDI